MATAPAPWQPPLSNPLAERIRAGGLAISLIVKQARTVDIALAAKACGYDAISIDLEHSVISESTAAQMCVAALNVGITPLVRVPSHDAHYATRILDAGALGIVAPHVDVPEQARDVVDACRFAPRGARSVAGSWPHFGFMPVPAEQARRVLDELTTVVVMLESPEAIENADGIAAVPGVDVLHVGTNDLCDAMRIPGQFTHPDVERALAHVVDVCRARGKTAGIGGIGGEPELAARLVARGARYMTAGNEWSMMMSAARDQCAALRRLPLG